MYIDIYIYIDKIFWCQFEACMGCHCWKLISYNSSNNYFVCFLLLVGVCVVHPLFLFLGLYCHINSFVQCFVLSGHESINHSIDLGKRKSCTW